MGSVCGQAETDGNASVSAKLEERKVLVVYGDYFDPDTRTICTLLNYGDIKFRFTNIDTFVGKHMESPYINLNPLGQIPLLEDNQYHVMGSTQIFVRYLTQSKSQIKALMPVEHTAKIEQHLNWFSSVLRPATRRLVRVLIGEKAFSENAMSGEESDAVKTHFFDKILPQLN